MNKEKHADFIKWFGPTLDALRALGGSGSPKEVTNLVAKNCNIDDDVIEEKTKTGVPKFYNQVAWARQYLVWEGLLDSSKYGVWALTEKGYSTKLDYEASRILFAKWVSIHAKSRKEKNKKKLIEEESETDPDSLESLDYKPTLLEVLQSLSSSGFERVCQRLLRESGFESVEVTGRSHDGGIDGIGTLQINPFVSFKVLFQCKRYKGTVSRAHVGDFRNAMIGRADKGIILTTGTFSVDAEKEANRDGAPHVELVDGKKLVEMFKMVELGVKPKTVYEVDMQFFNQFMDNHEK